MPRILALLVMLFVCTSSHASEDRCRFGVDVPERIHLEGVRVIVFVESQCFGVYENGALSKRGVGHYLFGYASTGARGHDTPRSEPNTSWNIFHADRDKVSSIYHLPMPCALFFNGDIALHAGSDLRPLRSHGCVRLPKRAACALYDHFRHGDIRVIVVEKKEDLRYWKE